MTTDTDQALLIDQLRAQLEAMTRERDVLLVESGNPGELTKRIRKEQMDAAGELVLDNLKLRDRLARAQAEAAAMRLVFEDMAKALNNIGVEFAGTTSNPQHAKDIAALRKIFERFDIQEYRWRDALFSTAGAQILEALRAARVALEKAKRSDAWKFGDYVDEALAKLDALGLGGGK